MRSRHLIWIALLAAWFGFVVLSGPRAHGVAHAAASAMPSACEGAGVADATLFLIGDAGAPRAPTEPLLEALAVAAGERVQALGAERVAIAFLGDNVYPDGLRRSDHEGRAEDERRLEAQLAVVQRSGARGYVVPGNHDWENGGPDGWEAVKRQTRFVAARGALSVPPDGCPGPVSAQLGARLGLVFLDTQWWLHAGARPEGDGSGCAEKDQAEIEGALEMALRDAGDRHAIVLGHHPLRSGGPHGAHFGWKEHLFPLREMNRSLWIPIPVLGSIRHVARMLGVSPQDVPSDAYQRMIESIERGFAAAPPLVYAAGHDHDLQVIRGSGATRFEVVSGAGSAPNLTWAHAIPGSLFAAAESGLARLDASAGGAVELTIETLDASGALNPAFRACLVESR